MSGRCDGCDQRFTTAEINSSHQNTDATRFFHPECCWLPKDVCALHDPDEDPF